MQIAIRADASFQIGTGHVMRCLALANGLSGIGSQVKFICRQQDGDLIDLISKNGFEACILPKTPEQNINETIPKIKHQHWLGSSWQSDAEQCRTILKNSVDWIIVDHYALDYRWEKAMRNHCNFIMCIDDLADRRHDCDILLDQSLGRTPSDYIKLVPSNTVLLLGPKFSPQRNEFSNWRKVSLERRKNPSLRHILITLGGVDIDNLTTSILLAINKYEIPTLEKITVVLGPRAPWLKKVKAFAENMRIPTKVLSGVNNMAELMTSSDLIVGAGGSTVWEKCTLGVPSVLFVLAENQKKITDSISKSKAAFVIDGVDDIEVSLLKFLENCKSIDILRNYSRSSASISDGKGLKRVISMICKHYENSMHKC